MNGTKKRPTSVKRVVILSNNDWNDFWYQRQEYARAFAASGYEVFFFNKTFTRMPRLRSLLRGNYAPRNRGYLKNPVPSGVQVVTPIWLPPYSIFRPLNRLILRRTIRQLGLSGGLLLIYSPTYNALDFMQLMQPAVSAYINVHHYEAQGVMKDMLVAERKIINQVSHLFADSRFNQRRLLSKLDQPGKSVHMSPPGVDVDSFWLAYRGDEAQSPRSLVYYGGIGDHLDFQLYGALANEYRVVFIGQTAPGAEQLLPEGIELLPPVENRKLGEVLRQFDVLCIFYQQSPYIDAVIPAKYYECLATRKPLLISGLKELATCQDVVYDVGGSKEQAEAVLGKLHESETEAVKDRRSAIAREASWQRRFDSFVTALGLDGVPDD